MTINAVIYESNSTTYTKSLYQYDKNVTLVFNGIDLPEKYEVHFSNEKDGGSISCVRIGTSNGVMIPNELLSTGKYVYAWVCGESDKSGVSTIFQVAIPVIPRPIPVSAQNTSSGDSDGCDCMAHYQIDEDDENLTFLGKTNIEEET